MADEVAGLMENLKFSEEELVDVSNEEEGQLLNQVDKGKVIGTTSSRLRPVKRTLKGKNEDNVQVTLRSLLHATPLLLQHTARAMHATLPCIKGSCSKQQLTSTPATGDLNPCSLHQTATLHQSCSKKDGNDHSRTKLKSSHHPPSRGSSGNHLRADPQPWFHLPCPKTLHIFPLH
ncbi:hypothetical protein V6N11_060391 [Hibiscus sabdariffa]|uniref:Uncharacterized protein n=1 Tax=Hibiscus sabdariffa TaxID=183260 RepID=A0ABR2QQQ9_9ROSI